MKDLKKKIPRYSEMFIPLLHALKALGGSANISELNAKSVEIMGLPEAVLDIQHNEKSTMSIVSYRLAWARSYLKKYGVINNSERGIWSFNENFDGNIDALSPVAIVQHVRKIHKDEAVQAVNDENLEDDGIELPEDVSDWRDELKGVLLGISPDAFERLALRLLRESGFVQLEVTGKSGDNGIDGKGIVRLNGVMSFHMIFQCKRYKGSVSPSEIRDFRGAMQGRADKGLFITTGTFSSAAKKEATRDGAPAIDLIDGDALVDMLKDLKLGIREEVIITYAYTVDRVWYEKV